MERNNVPATGCLAGTGSNASGRRAGCVNGGAVAGSDANNVGHDVLLSDCGGLGK
ncbi:MAG TPA: hypothetical protein VGB67_02735 [Fibrella sp.]